MYAKTVINIWINYTFNNSKEFDFGECKYFGKVCSARKPCSAGKPSRALIGL